MDLYDLYSSPNIIWEIKSRRKRWGWHVACSAYRVLMGKPVGKRPLGRPWHGWGENITMDLQEVGWGTWTELISSGYGQVVGDSECSNKPSCSKQ